MDNKNNSNNPVLDILSFLDQTFDAILDKELIEACEKTGDPIAIAVIKLCMEYGIHGKNLMEFTRKLSMIGELAKGQNE